MKIIALAIALLADLFGFLGRMFGFLSNELANSADRLTEWIEENQPLELIDGDSEAKSPEVS